jgi:dienelactone hydrolase
MLISSNVLISASWEAMMLSVGMSRLGLIFACVFAAGLCTSPSAAQIARTEVYPIQTSTPTDQEFLTGAKAANVATIAGVLRIPRLGTDLLPAVILVHGSGGMGGNVDYWSQQLTASGIATLGIDYLSGRGIVNTNSDQGKLPRLAEVIDIYNSLSLLGTHPRIDRTRIAVMGFSRGAQAALYSSLVRFQKMYGPKDLNLSAYVTFYTPCYTRYIEDEAVSGSPIRLFHGTADDYVPVVPCRAYVERLHKAGRDVQLTEYAGAHHVFDNPLLAEAPTVFPTWQTLRRCTLVEESPGRIVNAETRQAFTYADPCVELGPHIAYNAAALKEATQAVKDFFRQTFSLKQN